MIKVLSRHFLFKELRGRHKLTRETIYSSDGSTSLDVEVYKGRVQVYRDDECIFTISWNPEGWPAAHRVHSTDDHYGGFRILPRGLTRYYSEKTFDIMMTIFTLIRQDKLKKT